MYLWIINYMKRLCISCTNGKYLYKYGKLNMIKVGWVQNYLSSFSDRYVRLGNHYVRNRNHCTRMKNIHWEKDRCTVKPRLSGPWLSGFLEYPDFFSGPNLFMNICYSWSRFVTTFSLKLQRWNVKERQVCFALKKSKSNPRTRRN